MFKNIAWKFLVLSFFCLPFLSAAYAEDQLELQSVLAVSKMAGTCGIMDSMIDFQAKTKLKGGNEFVTRFWQAEAARLGMTTEQLSERCDGSIASYNKLWNAMEQPKK